MIAALAAGFVMAYVASAAPTGPIAVLVLQRSLRGQHVAALALGAGGALGEAGYAAFAVAGLGAVFERSPVAEVVVHGCGLVVLFLLGARLLQFQHAASRAGVEELRGETTARSFLKGLLIAAANPVLVLSWAGSLAMLYSVARVGFDGPARALFPVGVGVGIVASAATTVALVRRFRARLTEQIATWLVRAGGALMIMAGLAAVTALVLRAIDA